MSRLQGKTYGTRLTFLRERNKVSLEELAALTGISPKRLALIERDEREMRLQEALDICTHLKEHIDNFHVPEMLERKG